MKIYNKEIINMIKESQNLTFYKVMNYPVPKDYRQFMTSKHQNINKQKTQTFSRHKKNKYYNEYSKHINKYSKILQNLPFIKELYICNSFSFNALKKDSDIDLFLVAKEWALRRARFFSVILMRINWILRKKYIKKKFCLSFYITETNKNLYNISIDKADIYLSYRIAHLYPIYKTNTKKKNIREENQRIQNILPNTKTEQNINLKIQIKKSKKIFKKTIEFLLNNKMGNIIECVIKSIRSPIVIRKKRKLGPKWLWIIINKNILKFYEDKREKYHLIYQLEKKHQQKI